MTIQIFGKKKCFDTKKAERYFKERKIPFQSIDVAKFGMSKGELASVKTAVGGLDALIDEKSPDAALLRYLAYDSDREVKLLENPRLFRTPIVRNGRQATVGYQPEIWKSWEKARVRNIPKGHPIFFFQRSSGGGKIIPLTAASPEILPRR